MNWMCKYNKEKLEELLNPIKDRTPWWVKLSKWKLEDSPKGEK